METLWKELIQRATSVGLNLLGALLVLIVGIKVSKWLIKWLEKGRAFQKLDAGVRTFLLSALHVVLLALVFLTAAYILGIPTTSFLTVLASAGLAIGLALQGSLSNLAGGLMILIFKPFRVGDFIEVNGKSGTVHDITVFYTILHAPDNKVITIPNGTVTAGDITNYWTLEQVRLDVPCSTAYDADIARTREVLLAVAAARAEILTDPAPQVVLDKMGESSLDYILRVWVCGRDYWQTRYALNEAVKTAFDHNGIGIPFPQLDIHTDR